MACKCATYNRDSGRFDCSVSGSECIYLIPNSKRCAGEYGEGPDANSETVTENTDDKQVDPSSFMVADPANASFTETGKAQKMNHSNFSNS